MADNKGCFVVFEGLDASGKGTMLARTAEWLFNSHAVDKILLTREPTNSSHGKQIRKLLQKDEEPMTKAKQLLNLYLEDRKEHLQKVIKPALQLNTFVLCDRYKHSTICYQQAQGIPLEKIIALHERMLVPDLTLILDVSAETALERIGKNRAKYEKFEKKFFLEELRQNYLALKKQLPGENIKVINAELPEDEVFSQVKRAVSGVLK